MAEIFSRRDCLKVAASAAVSLGSLWLAHGTKRTRTPLITLFLSGGASSKETFTPDNPNVSEELRGSLSTIQTRTGVRFSECFPMLAERSQHFALLRAIDTGSPDHIHAAKNLALRGNKTLAQDVGERSADGGVTYSFLNPGRTWPAVHEAFQQNLSFAPQWRDGRFVPPEIPSVDLRERRELLNAFERDISIQSPIADRIGRFRETAFDLLQGGGRFFEAFNLPERERDRYGRTLAGDGMLLARRMVELGAGAVTLYHETPPDWDMHDGISQKIRTAAPGVDRAAAAIIDDILNHRLNCVFLLTSEFTRTPRINGNGGRDHWQYGNNAILAGGLIRPGIVHGRMNPRGEIVDGGVQQRGALGNTIIVATGGELSPAEPRVREVLR